MTYILPQPRTRFFGRSRSLGHVRELLAEQSLVTLTGAGGVGKTRLALRVAEEAVPTIADEIGWVELAALQDPRLVAATVCSSLGIQLAPNAPALEALSKRLQTSRWLLVLDNCEHLVDGCADLVRVLLEQCPELHILATSREALGLEVEYRFDVPPLSAPAEGIGAGAGVDQAMESAAVQVFVDRARTANPAFELTPDNLQAVVMLCNWLEGIPLALELAAARVRVLSVDQITRRLDKALSLLARSGREGPERHRTMRAALSWSHDLLPEEERALFRRLSVFAGGTDLDACESVCESRMLERSQILDLLARLVEQSLVTVEERESTARYRLLEPVRQFADERLVEAGERDDMRVRHGAYYLEFASRFAPGLRGPARVEVLRHFELEHDNLRRAWAHAVDLADARAVTGLTRALFWFWHFTGRIVEGRTRVEEALDRLRPSGEMRPVLRHAAGTMAWIQGDFDVASERLQSCVAECRDLENDRLMGVALRELAGVRMALGELEAAASLYEESIERLHEANEAWDMALATLMLADVREALGDPGRSHGLREKARQLFRKTGDPWGLSLAQFSNGLGAARAGNLDEARVQAREALVLQGGHGDSWNIGQIRTLLGEIEERAGNAGEAAEHLLNATEAFREVGDRNSLTHVVQSLAEVERRRGRTLRAVRLAAAGRAQAETLEGFYPYPLATEEDRARTETRLRRAAGEQAFAEEWERGSSMTFDEVIGFALDIPAARTSESPETGEAEAGASLRVFALGPADVHRGWRRLRPSDWTFALPRELLFYLLIQGPRTKEQIGLDFWPEASPEQLRGRFRTVLYQLRRALGGTEWVVYRDGRYEFNRALDYWFDVEAFEEYLDEAVPLLESDPSAAELSLQAGMELYRGEFLEGASPGEWAQEPRDRLRRRYFDALLTLAELYTARDAHAAAADIYRRAVKCDNLSEQAYRELSRSLSAGGDRAGALRCLDELADLLREELDVEPSPETRALRAELERNPDP